MRSSLLALALATPALIGACELFPSTVDLPLPLDTPPFDVDVGAAVDEGTTSACAAPDSLSCQGIGIICQAEAGAPCDPVDLPPRFPAEIDVDGTPTKAEDLLPEEITDAARIKLAIPVDLTSTLADAGVTDPAQVKAITFTEVAIGWEANSLTFDAPVLDVYVGPQSDDLSDPEALVADAAFVKVGSVGIDLDEAAPGFEVGQLAGTTGAVPLTFVAGGNDAFNDRLKEFAFTLVLVAPDGQTVKLKAVDGDATKVQRPDGEASIKLESTLTWTVDLGGAVADLEG